jgi:hypothetical protein
MVKVVSLYSGPDGESHFREIEVNLKTKAPSPAKESKSVKVSELLFREGKGPDIKNDWHPAPFRQLIVILQGEMLVEIGDGSKRRLGQGEILLAEDTTGHGHITYPLYKSAIYIPVGDAILE